MCSENIKDQVLLIVNEFMKTKRQPNFITVVNGNPKPLHFNEEHSTTATIVENDSNKIMFPDGSMIALKKFIEYLPEFGLECRHEYEVRRRYNFFMDFIESDDVVNPLIAKKS